MMAEVNAEELKVKGNEAYKRKQYKEAIELYKKGIAVSSSNQYKALIASNLANSYFQLKGYEDALEWALRGCKLDTSNLKVFYWKAMSLWKLGKFDKALEITEGLLKKDIGNISFKELAENLVKDHKQKNVSKRIEYIKVCISKNDYKNVKDLIEENINDSKEILIDSKIIQHIIELLWNNRKNINEPLIEILIYFLDTCTKLKLDPIQCTQFSMIADILTTTPKYIPEFLHRWLIRRQLDIKLLEFLNSLFISDLTNDYFVPICNVLLCKADGEIEILLKLLNAFLEKLADLLLESKDPYNLHKECMESIAAFVNEIKDKVRTIEFLKENIFLVNKNVSMKSLITCELFAHINPKEFVDYLASKNYLVLLHIKRVDVDKYSRVR